MKIKIGKRMVPVYWFSKYRDKSMSHWSDFYLKHTEDKKNPKKIDWNRRYTLSLGKCLDWNFIF